MKFKPKLVWKILLLARFLFVFWPQTGYIHPDEFFQGPEVASGHILGLPVEDPWEFRTTSPIRSFLSTYSGAGLPYLLLDLGHRILGYTATSYTLLVLPRLVMTVASLFHDWMLYKLCTIVGKNPYIPLTVFSSSYVCTVFYTRTFNNSIESLLFSALLCTVGTALIQSGNDLKRSEKYIPGYFRFIGATVALGFFVRPTFLIFACCPITILFLLSANYKTESRLWKYLSCFNNFSFSFTLTSLVLIALDTVYYRGANYFYAMLNLNFRDAIENAVVTPINFLKYNLHSSNLENHGLHPWYLHLVVHVPLLYGVLGISGFYFCIRMLWKGVIEREWDSNCMLTFMMTVSWLFPILMLSIFPHQEPRFIIPILFPLAFLYGKFVLKWKAMFMFWFVTNILLMLFFGFVHQGGLVPCLLFLSKNISRSSTTNVVFYHTYMPPMHLLQIGKNQRTTVHDLKGQGMDALVVLLSNLTTEKSGDVYLVTPASVEQPMNSAMIGKINFELLKSFFPHFSSEDPPIISNVKEAFQQMHNHFSLNLYHVHKLQYVLR